MLNNSRRIGLCHTNNDGGFPCFSSRTERQHGSQGVVSTQSKKRWPLSGIQWPGVTGNGTEETQGHPSLLCTSTAGLGFHHQHSHAEQFNTNGYWDKRRDGAIRDSVIAGVFIIVFVVVVFLHFLFYNTGLVATQTETQSKVESQLGPGHFFNQHIQEEEKDNKQHGTLSRGKFWWEWESVWEWCLLW